MVSLGTELGRNSIRFPRSGHIWIPVTGRRAAAAGIAMHSPCRSHIVWAQRALYLAVLVAGPRIIPGERGRWVTPVEEDVWSVLLESWSSCVGKFDELVLYRRPQAGRTGFAALLLRDGKGIAFARYHPDGSRILREYGVVSAVHGARPRSFAVARPIAAGKLADDAGWLLSESLPNYPLGAVRSERVREVVAREVSEVLADAITRPSGTPGDWVPAHGDFAPWNLRTLLSGRVCVIDWEDVTFAPAGVDQLYGALTAHATFGSAMPSDAPAEAIEWILRLVRARGHDSPEDAALITWLEQVPPR